MQKSNTNYDTIIIGGGAAGLMCAIEAGKRGRNVLLIEHNEHIGKKILISGGGRCNFTNKNVSADNFTSANPHFCKSALARYTPNDFIHLVEKHNIAYHEKKLGQLFCDGSAKQIVEMLLKECNAVGINILLSCEIQHISKSISFSVETNLGTFESETLVIASGGLSIPKIGASKFGFDTARQFDIKIIEPQPALVPFVFSSEQEKQFNHLSGIALEAIVTCNAQSFQENILFTHRGLSGPAILQISSYWNSGDSLFINLFPNEQVENILWKHQQSKISLSTLLAQYFPKRFVEILGTQFSLPKPMYQWNEKELKTLSIFLSSWKVTPVATEGFEKAEVTRGGIDTTELSSKTLEAKNVRGLFFIGEVVDVTGWLGGYNFQWAWSSGVATGKSA